MLLARLNHQASAVAASLVRIGLSAERDRGTRFFVRSPILWLAAADAAFTPVLPAAVLVLGAATWAAYAFVCLACFSGSVTTRCFATMPFSALGIVVADEADVADRVISDELLLVGMPDDCSPALLATHFRGQVGSLALLGSNSRRFKMFRDREMQQPLMGRLPIFGPGVEVGDMDVFLMLQGPRE